MEQSTNNGDDSRGNSDVFLVEYQKAQDSAEHHDSLVWTVTSIIWTGNLVLLGFVLSSLAKPNTQRLLTVPCILGAVLVICVFILAVSFGWVKRQKYQRCKSLEERWDFQQHRQLRYPKRLQTILYIIVTLAFLVIWGVVISVVWTNQPEQQHNESVRQTTPPRQTQQAIEARPGWFEQMGFKEGQQSPVLVSFRLHESRDGEDCYLHICRDV